MLCNGVHATYKHEPGVLDSVDPTRNRASKHQVILRPNIPQPSPKQLKEAGTAAVLACLDRMHAAWRPAVLRAMWPRADKRQDGGLQQLALSEELQPTQDQAAAIELVLQYLGQGSHSK